MNIIDYYQNEPVLDENALKQRVDSQKEMHLIDYYLISMPMTITDNPQIDSNINSDNND